VKLTILGGGGFRVPLVYRALLDQHPRITELHLHDVDETRLRVIGTVLSELACPDAPEVSLTTSLDDAIVGARADARHRR
jgi:6-phospho-beta-glucosidase